MKDTTINLRISKQLLDLIDKDRGLIPRSAYIRDVLEKKIGYGIQPDKPEIQPVESDNKRAKNSANAARAEKIREKISDGISSLSPETKLEIMGARYPKNEFRKAIGETVSKDSIAKYWDEIAEKLNAG